MSGLKGMFDDEFRDLSASLRDAPEFDELAAVRSVRRRRTTRTMTVAAGGVLAVAAVGVGAFAWGGGSDAGPATSVSPTPSPSVSESPSASPSPTPSQTVDATPTLEDAGPGWFLLDVQVAEDTVVDGSDDWLLATRSTDMLLLLSPDGATAEVLEVADYDASVPVAWFGDEVALLRQQPTADSFGLAGTLLTVDLDSGDVIQVVEEDPDTGYDFYYQPWIGALEGGAEIVTGQFGGDTTSYAVGAVDATSTELCSSFTAPSEYALSPTGDRVVCFWIDDTRVASDTAEYSADDYPATSVVVAATDGSASVPLVGLSRYPMAYSYVGWVSDTEMLFAREGDGGDYAYFVLDTDTGEVSDANVPLEASDRLAIYDHDTATYARGQGTDVVFYNRSGVSIARTTCADEVRRADYLTAYSGDRAVVMCGGSTDVGGDGEGSRAAVWLVDLVDGGATEIDLSAYPDGDYRTRALPYWGE